MTYERIPLAVQVVIRRDGSIVPQKVMFEKTPYHITSIVSVKRFCPRIVPCIAPVEYTVVINGILKRIYYESDTNKWFSVKERNENDPQAY
ncbi:MAG: hypothetical protein IKA82_02335 [Clostridia bacterium]|nr:hypothetical protein [Clostridia bacterium]